MVFVGSVNAFQWETAECENPKYPLDQLALVGYSGYLEFVPMCCVLLVGQLGPQTVVSRGFVWRDLSGAGLPFPYVFKAGNDREVIQVSKFA